MEEIINNITELFIYDYTLSVMLLTYVILNNIIKKPKDWIKSLVVCLVGIVLGLVWYYISTDLEPSKLIYSFIFANAFYSIIIKLILKRLNVNYNNDKGIL